jgi:hypothetical protein
MNLFYLNIHPIVAANSQCDKHVVKMLLETAQLLSTAVRIITDYTTEDPDLYKITHRNHPVAIWVRSSRLNFEWTLIHGIALCHEYTRRYKRTHKSQAVILFIQTILDELEFPIIEFTTPALCMPDQYKTFSDDPVLCYQEYYKNEKSKFAKWKYTSKPEWFTV